ncbi:hypothetical protein BJ944DRAFT_157341 [Cunninghamella echinulata]|nr:hypothetical protein BJ944DRAFT_157341 [Cunninghamella echinulata]
MKQRKYEPIDPNVIQELCQQRKNLYQQLLQLRAQRNALSKAAAAHKKKKNGNNNAIHKKETLTTTATSLALEENTRERSIQQAQQLKSTIKQYELQLETIESQLTTQALLIPNLIHDQVPKHGEPVIVKQIEGHIPSPSSSSSSEWKRLDHVELNEKLKFMDLEQASKVTGSSFYYLQGIGAYLELALIQYAMDKAVQRGYLGIMTPDIVRSSIVNACGFQPRSGESQQIYRINNQQYQQQQINDIDKHESEDSTLCLVGTAEIPLAGKFMDKIVPENQLPKKCVGFSHAFRMEAGGRGVETKGLYRVHQFSKVELFAITTPEQSEDMIDEFKSLQEEIFTDLGLTFRILDMPTNELGASAYRKYDMEAWLPGKQKWGEISSTSNCTDYQARRLSIRYRPTHPTKENTLFCHTLNGTAMAVPRVIIAILESYQCPDGSIDIPKVLQKWIPGQPTKFFGDEINYY